MKEWEITYTADKHNFKTMVIKAATYTMAVLEFVTKYPQYDYKEVREKK